MSAVVGIVERLVPDVLFERVRSVRSDRSPSVHGVEQDAVWAELHRPVLDELGARGELDRSRCAIDSVNMRALKGGI